MQRSHTNHRKTPILFLRLFFHGTPMKREIQCVLVSSILLLIACPPVPMTWFSWTYWKCDHSDSVRWEEVTPVTTLRTVGGRGKEASQEVKEVMLAGGESSGKAMKKVPWHSGPSVLMIFYYTYIFFCCRLSNFSFHYMKYPVSLVNAFIYKLVWVVLLSAVA